MILLVIFKILLILKTHLYIKIKFVNINKYRKKLKKNYLNRCFVNKKKEIKNCIQCNIDK